MRSCFQRHPFGHQHLCRLRMVQVIRSQQYCCPGHKTLSSCWLGFPEFIKGEFVEPNRKLLNLERAPIQKPKTTTSPTSGEENICSDSAPYTLKISTVFRGSRLQAKSDPRFPRSNCLGCSSYLTSRLSPGNKGTSCNHGCNLRTLLHYHGT